MCFIRQFKSVRLQSATGLSVFDKHLIPLDHSSLIRLLFVLSSRLRKRVRKLVFVRAKCGRAARLQALPFNLNLMYVVCHKVFGSVLYRADSSKTRLTYTNNPQKARVYRSLIRAWFVCLFSKDDLLILNHVD